MFLLCIGQAHGRLVKSRTRGQSYRWQHTDDFLTKAPLAQESVSRNQTDRKNSPTPARLCCAQHPSRLLLQLQAMPAGSDHLELGLLDGHPVRYALHTVYVAGEFAGQGQFGGITGLAIQGDHATLRLDLGVDGTGRVVR